MTKVYLAGPINGCSDTEANDWRDEASRLLVAEFISPMARDYRGQEDANIAAIVEGDKADIDSCAAVLAFCPKPSFGTAMEILYAWERYIPVFVVCPSWGWTRPVSPWIQYHATEVFRSVADAVGRINEVI